MLYLVLEGYFLRNLGEGTLKIISILEIGAVGKS